jgi:hypothetical protein
LRFRSARSRRKQAAPMESSTLVESTLRWLKLDDTVRGLRAMRAFGEAAGPRIRARARAERLRGRTLYVRVATSAWSQELHILSAAILERMHALPGGLEVETLRFQVGDIGALPEWAEAPVGPASEEPRVEVPLGPALDAALADIADVELRDTFAHLLARASREPRRPAKRR